MDTQAASDTIKNLNIARNYALADASHYESIVPGVLPIIGASAALDIRRWGSDFLSETFASPVLLADVKQRLSLQVLQTLKEYLEKTGEDLEVVKSTVQTAASVYPLVFRYIVSNPNDAATWQRMAAIKSNILRRMDTAPVGVRICCVKFVQRVVQVQTPGVIADPRRPEQNEVSLALVPRDHPLIPPPNLEAEASGLLDRLLGILQEDVKDAILVSATLNSLSVLIRTRASVAAKIISVVLSFNPFTQATQPMSPKTKVMVRSMERTTKALLTNITKRNPQHPLAARIGQYLERLNQSRIEVFDERNLKRPAPTEPTDGFDQAKRQRVEASLNSAPDQRTSVPALPPGPTSVAQLFTLTQDAGAKGFDALMLPTDLVVRILVPVLMSIDASKMNNAINTVRSRYLSLSRQSPLSTFSTSQVATGQLVPAQQVPSGATEDLEQISNRLDQEPADDITRTQPLPALGPFKIPQPPPLTEDETQACGEGTVMRVFELMNALEEAPPAARAIAKSGFNRLAASSYDRDAWVTVITRLATRAPAGLQDDGKGIKQEDAMIRHSGFSLANIIRESLYLYILADFRHRISVAISWLNEEWYNDLVTLSSTSSSRSSSSSSEQQLPFHNKPSVSSIPAEKTSTYDKWAVRLIDGFIPYLDVKDNKVLIRFLSEIPKIGTEMLERVKKLARDPERVGLAVNSIFYLVLLRPPVREIALDALEDLWRNYDDARTAAGKHLAKWRPAVLQDASNQGTVIKIEGATPTPAPQSAPT